MKMERREAGFMERFVSAVIGPVDGERPFVVATVGRRPFDPSAPWVHFGGGQGGTVAVAWAEHSGLLLRSGFEAAAARRLQRHGGFQQWGLTPGFDGVWPCAQTELHLISPNLTRRVAWFASPGEPCEGREASEVEQRILGASRYSVSVVWRGVTPELAVGALVFLDQCGLRLPDGVLWSRGWRRHPGGIVVTMEEEMEQTEQIPGAERERLLQSGVVVDLAIGSFELKLGEILALRPGSEVLVPCGRDLRGTVRVGGGAIATVTLTFEGDGLVARVIDLNPLAEGTLGETEISGNFGANRPIPLEESRRSPRLRQVEVGETNGIRTVSEET